jgi:predicted chitinase
VLAVTKIVNGGTNGLEDREMYYQRCLKAIP